MKHKSALLLTSFLFSISASAQPIDLKGEAPCKPIPVLKDGMYLGFQVGYDAYGFQQTAYRRTPITINSTLNAVDWAFGAFAGFGMYFRNLYYLGLEAFGNYNGATQGITLPLFPFSNPPVSYDAKFNAQSSFGLSALPGFRLNNATLAYVRLGYVWTSINNKIKFTIPNGSAFASNRINAGGFNYGVGLETILMGPISLRGEYTHTDYGAYNIGLVRVKPEDDQFMLSLVYHPTL